MRTIVGHVHVQCQSISPGRVTYQRTPRSGSRTTGARGDVRFRTAASSAEWSFREATAADMPAISSALLREKMNPLSLVAARFRVAEGDDKSLLGFGQLAPLGGGVSEGPQPLELRSLVVQPGHRGVGLGKELLGELVEGAAHADVFLTTLGSTAPFYESAGFSILPVSRIPRSLYFEYAAGTVVAAIAARQRLIVMKRPAVK